VLSRRTAIDPGPPVELDVETDELSFYPLIYWPIVPEAPRPTAAGIERVQRYLKGGGMIMFDTREVDLVGRREHRSRPVEVAVAYRPADAGAADDLAVETDRLDDFDGRRARREHRLEVVHIRVSVVAVAEIGGGDHGYDEYEQNGDG
jgi:hypothetical protein